MHESSDAGLRRRGGGGGERSPMDINEGSIEKAKKIVKKFDIYAKVKEEYKDPKPGTLEGGYVTLTSWILVIILSLAEIWAYASSGGVREHMIVDSTLGQKLRINVNVTFPALSCAEVHVDAMDVAGDYHPYMEHNMLKQRLDPRGRPLGRKVEEKANVVENKDQMLPKDYCGSCYGAGEHEGDCCNTCEQVLSRYSSRGWATKDIRRDSEQCKREQNNPLLAVKDDEGCNLSGFMLVNKVAGNFHVALGESVVRDGRFIHQFQPQDAPKFNTSHTVHSLSFGVEYPGMPVNPMDGVTKLADKEQGTGLYQYFIKLVPTVYESKGDDNIVTNQFSYTERFRPLASSMGGARNVQKDTKEEDKDHPGHDDHNKHGSSHHQPVATTVLPGVFWVYDLSAFQIQIQQVPTSFTHFLTRLCAVAGGVFTVSRLIHSCVDRARPLFGL